MNRRLIVSPEAESDIAEAVFWYNRREPNLGLELIEEIHALFISIIRQEVNTNRGKKAAGEAFATKGAQTCGRAAVIRSIVFT